MNGDDPELRLELDDSGEDWPPKEQDDRFVDRGDSLDLESEHTAEPPERDQAELAAEDAVVQEDPVAPVFGATDAPYLLTNRYNLLEILSSGLIKPVQGFPKYYSDLLQLAPGWLPLLRGSAGETLVAAVSQDDETAFPVALELDVDQSALEQARSYEDGEASAFAMQGVIPAEHIARIHFRSEVERDEVRARRFANLEIPEDRLTVSPALFEGTSGSEIIDWLMELGATQIPELGELDKLAGAWAMVAAAAPPSGDHLEFAAELLVGFERQPRASDEVPTWIAGGRLRTLKTDRRRTLSTNDRIYEASIEAMLGADPNLEWRPASIVDQIETEVLTAVEDTERAALETAFGYVRAVVRNEADIQPFKPDAGYPSLKALLMVLMRPEPDRMLAWLGSEVNPRYPEYMAGAALSGLLAGWSQIPVAIRPGRIESVVMNRVASAVNSRLSPAFECEALPSGKPTTEVTVGATGDGVFVTAIGRTSVLERSFDLNVEQLIRWTDILPTSLAMIELAELGGWIDECVYSAVSARPIRGKGGDGETVFAGKPAINVSVDSAAVRLRVLEAGLPPGAERLRAGLLRDRVPETESQ